MFVCVCVCVSCVCVCVCVCEFVRDLGLMQCVSVSVSACE